MAALSRNAFSRRGWSLQRGSTAPIELDRAHPLSRGLQGFWPLTTNANSLTGTNNGTLTASPTFAAGPIGPMVSTGIGYVDAGTAVDPPATTLCIWAVPSALSNAYSTVLSRCNAGSTNYAELHIKSSGKLACYVRNSGTGTSYDGTGSNTLSTNTLYFLAFTYDSTSGLVAYVNGASDGTSSANGPLTTGGAPSTYFGNTAGSANNKFNGTIGRARVYDRALSAAEVFQLYQEPWAGTRPVARRLFSVSSGGIASGDGSAAGSASVSGVGASLAAASGTSAGSATVAGAAAALAGAVGTVSDAGATVSGTGAALAGSVGASAGVATATGVGVAQAAASGAADGTSTASGVSAVTSAATGTAAGSSTVSGVGGALAAAVATSAGAGNALGVAAALSAAIGTATGTSTASGVTPGGAPAMGTAAGTSTVTGVGAATARATGSAAGTSTVTGVSAASATGFATGAASVAGVGRSLVSATGTASGAVLVVSTGRSLAGATGTAFGISRVAGVALQIAPPSQAATTRHRTVAIPTDRRLVAVPLDLRIARGTMTDLEFLPKDPADDLNDYQIRFGASLNAITSVTATLSQSAGAVPTGAWTTPGDTLPGSALSVSAPRISDDRKAVIFRAAGGVPGKKYAIRAVVQTTAGSLNRSAILPVTGL